MEQEVRFCTAEDGVRIAFATVGDGPPLVKTANWLNHLEFDWESPVWRHVFRELASHHRLVRYDERGNGLSDWTVETFSFDCMVRDLETVVDAAGLERFTLLGISQGCAVAIAYAVRHPERVERIVLYGGYAVGWRVRGTPEEIRRREAMLTLTREGWATDSDAYRQLFTLLYIPDGTPEQVRWFNDLQRVTTSPENAATLQDVFGRIDVRSLLPRVQAPTLVMHARDDGPVPFSCGRELAATIPDARFVALPSRNHLLLEEEPAWPRFVAELRSFLGVEPASGPEEDLHRRREDALFSRLLDLSTEERRRQLERTEHADLRAQVERRLAEADRAGGIFAPGDALDGTFARRLAGSDDATGDPFRLPEGLRPGATVAGRYRIESPLGRGGMGVVFRAHDVMLDRDVALKVAAIGALDPSWRQRALREARSAAALNHPNVVSIHDVGDVDGLPYLVLELVSGPNLADRPPGSVEEVLAVSRQICDALAHAHSRGLVHRDLKPTNVLWVSREGAPVVKLTDLGVALMARDPRITGTGKILGTPAYMAPEQALGKEVDARTDLYSLGVMLYEWLIGAPPFVADSPLAVVAQHVHAEPDPPSRRREGLPGGLDGVVERLLAKDPDSRFPSAPDLRAALDRL